VAHGSRTRDVMGGKAQQQHHQQARMSINMQAMAMLALH
jgi:hypothetical protein